jgi:PPK2 family polyphosphate:nucleotide phosphotransferase
LPHTVHTKRYAVEPGKKVRLEEWDPNDTSGFEGTEEDARKDAVSLDKTLDELQELLFAEHKHKVLVVLQAMDTGGKDGTIRRIFQGTNPSGIRVAHFREPSQDELDHDFLWRVHKQVPGSGELTIFNRSHYEGVLVERVHKLVPEYTWRARYRQINEFERMLSEQDTTLLKFYLHIDAEEQKRRIQERLDDPKKHWKLSEDDLAERKLWGEYMKAYEQAIEETSTRRAPWYIVPANHKWFRDVVVASVVVSSLKSLKMKYPPLTVDPNLIAKAWPPVAARSVSAMR